MGWSRETKRRWRAIVVWLLRSRRWATRARHRPIFRPPPDLPVSLPQYDRSPERAAELREAKGNYRLIPVAEKLGLPVAWNHRTVEKLPSADTYTKTLKLPKFALVMALTKPLLRPGKPDERWDSLAQVDEAFDLLGFPAVRDLWQDDLEFARLRVAGPNPVWLRGGWTVERIRAAGLADAGIKELRSAARNPDFDWANVYAVDYHEVLQDAVPTQDRYIYPCFAVFEEQDGVLRPVGIQLQLPDGDLVWRPADGSPAWRLAKVFFGSADIFVHEVISHWLWTHVVAEKLGIASARNLSWRHPLRRLIAPHLTSTLAMNFNATAILVGPGGTFDTTFAGAAVKARLVEYGDRAWTYAHMIHPRRVAQLGVEGLTYHPFRDDGQLVWDAIEAHVREYLRMVYPDDGELKADDEVRAWAAEIHADLGNQGFPEVCDRETLNEVVTAILFNPVHHALVNSLQFDVFGWPPLSPPTVPVPMPADPSEVTEETLVQALPSVRVTLDTVRSTFGFSAQYDQYGSHLEPFYTGPTSALLARFKKELEAVTATINVRNSARGFAYRVARPDLIGNSIDA